jgi:hypothetical protein
MTKEDNSPELKKGEIKGILINGFKKHLPEFEFADYRGNQYNFQRTRKHREFTVWETLHVLFSLNDKNFACSVSSRLNKDYVTSKSYNIELINPHVDLIALKKGRGVVGIEEAYYFHNGKVHTTTKLVEQICKDFVAHGVPFLDRQYDRLKSNEIVNAGLNYIQQLHIDRQTLKYEINNELKQVGYIASRLTHPVYVNLKEILQAVPKQTREDRQKISGFACELLELFWTAQ